MSDNPQVLLALDKESFDKLIKASLAKDYMGIQELLDSGGTTVLVIDDAWGARRVRVTNGQYIGRTGWTVMEALHAK